jgi:hypothetical protein
MSHKNRTAAKIDENQPDIVKTLRSIPGVTVELNHDDILVGYKGVTYWFEIKDPAKTLNKDGTYRKGAIKPSQKKLLKEWTGHYEVVNSIDQILKTLVIK